MTVYNDLICIVDSGCPGSYISIVSGSSVAERCFSGVEQLQKRYIVS